ncbi:unnamed protein product [Rotaria socialis]|uniref:DUF8206 domain-containing protein n=1 Tax=Rotaria socialis TaxID=392032 RepID=A0A817Q554_9BILA|nr:unnamed protein product [Rotaria socialis]CAF3192635.1 unnamed protein product [Rotaria socialis]CAF3309208.1 unnamed protein product [Rotaria socialis]CAF3649974.1 unnamed protein product [Rotaria socialis]CAF4337023.1 unnamed protein product [Rotaria socialis]
MAKTNEPLMIKANRNSDPSNDINVLLLGQTGVGISTFINALANYLCNDTLEEACKDKIQAVIPSAFSFTDGNTLEQKTIEIGQRNEHEDCNEEGRSCTQRCRSFVFPVGDKNLRIINSPVIGDTRGLELDTKAFSDILTFISQYEHLNGICILLKPNEERLTILFRFCINELLRHLHKSAHQNIIFVFTNARATFFKPGATSKILRVLLDQHKKDHDVDVPFSRDNTFLLDNESFRYLALRKNGVRLNNDQLLSYQKSWDHTIKEYSNLINCIVTRPLFAVSNAFSLNEAEQLVRKLTRPIAEIAKLIQENIQLAKQHKENVLKNPQLANQGLPQNEAKIIPLAHPRTVCINEKCCKSITVNNQTKIEYISKCHEECYLKGVVQETINDRRMQECEAMNYKTGKCLKCNCLWSEHQHITYEYETNIARLNGSCSLADIDKRISDLRDEQTKIEDIYKKLAKFLHANSMLPLNDDILEYLRLFIREEQMKKNSGSQNNDVIQGLKEMMKSYEQEMELFKRTIDSEKDRSSSKDVLKSYEIFSLVGTLYRLPINGSKIREQVNGLNINQTKLISKQEVLVELPAKADSSALMRQFKNIMSSN